jgi:hypothetical protein
MPNRNALTTCALAICLAAGGPACRAASASTQAPAVYANVRYAYTIEYPRNLLVPGEEADDGDGVVFSAKSGTARVTVWGRFNANGDTPARILHNEAQPYCPDPATRYAVSKRTLVAFSCASAHHQIVYEKVLIHGDTLVAVQFIYPAAEKATWSPVVREMAGSLHVE